MTPALGRKQQLSSQSVWLLAKRRAEFLSRVIDRRIDQTIERVRNVVGARSLAFGWSGGKDSIVLERVLAQAGFRDCLLVITRLEYRQFLEWVTEHMPERLTVIRTKHDLDWLRQNQDMLFPTDSSIAAHWFREVQHTGQERYVKREGLDMLAVGRRLKDGNYCGPNGIYTNSRGITRFAPLYDWTHEEIFAALHYFKAELPPCYGWPRGYQVGTGPWPARQWAPTIRAAWEEIWRIEPEILSAAAGAGIAGAQEFLEERDGDF